ncbi:hypothetical protein AC579_1922 [Pseudocercospora musae]|uniref:Uncharacterized protein n=1 Tax=Pseudocercospora musae TaxID=113226 RepID=A0A139HFJ6_9PEZI|nr:hypothetical protein AC579_1922 [Pseudocercospora musae]
MSGSDDDGTLIRITCRQVHDTLDKILEEVPGDTLKDKSLTINRMIKVTNRFDAFMNWWILNAKFLINTVQTSSKADMKTFVIAKEQTTADIHTVHRFLFQTVIRFEQSVLGRIANGSILRVGLRRLDAKVINNPALVVLADAMFDDLRVPFHNIICDRLQGWHRSQEVMLACSIGGNGVEGQKKILQNTCEVFNLGQLDWRRRKSRRRSLPRLDVRDLNKDARLCSSLALLSSYAFTLSRRNSSEKTRLLIEFNPRDFGNHELSSALPESAPGIPKKARMYAIWPAPWNAAAPGRAEEIHLIANWPVLLVSTKAEYSVAFDVGRASPIGKTRELRQLLAFNLGQEAVVAGYSQMRPLPHNAATIPSRQQLALCPLHEQRPSHINAATTQSQFPRSERGGGPTPPLPSHPGRFELHKDIEDGPNKPDYSELARTFATLNLGGGGNHNGKDKA